MLSIRHTLRGKSPRAREVARIPATLQTPLKDIKPPASWIRFRSFNCFFLAKKETCSNGRQVVYEEFTYLLRLVIER